MLKNLYCLFRSLIGNFAPSLNSDSNYSETDERFNYIVWIQDLLDTTSESYTDRYDAERTVTGLDM